MKYDDDCWNGHPLGNSFCPLRLFVNWVSYLAAATAPSSLLLFCDTRFLLLLFHVNSCLTLAETVVGTSSQPGRGVEDFISLY